MPEEHKNILLVEDSEDDETLFRIVCRRAGIINPMLVVRDGEEAMAYLKGEGKFADRHQHPVPALIVLDLKLPKRNGHEVLQWLRGQADLRSIPVMVLTGSTLEEDKRKAEDLGAKWFVEKPCEIQTLNTLAEQAPAVWMRRK